MPLLDKLREQYGVGPVCSELHIAPSTYYQKELERENRELRRSNDILRQASAYFAKAEFDRLWKK